MKFPIRRKHNILKRAICLFLYIFYYLNILNFENIIISCYNVKSRTEFYKNKNTKKCVSLFIDNTKNVTSIRKRNAFNLLNHKNKKTKLNFFSENKKYYNKSTKIPLINKYSKKTYFFTFKKNGKLNSQNYHSQFSKANENPKDMSELENRNIKESFPNSILISLSEVFDFSIFYGTETDRKYYKYEDIIKYIEGTKWGNKFLENIKINNNLSKNYNKRKDNEEIYFDDKPILIRGRIEKKDKQSQRIILYLRQNSGLYIICVYEKKKTRNENTSKISNTISIENGEKDEMYTYIKNIKNETVVDIIGNIKINKKLYKHKIPHIESIYNQKRIEIQIKNIYKISESYYVPPIIPNDIPFLRTNILCNDKGYFKTKQPYEHGEKEENENKNIYEHIDKQIQSNIPPSFINDNIKNNKNDFSINNNYQSDFQNEQVVYPNIKDNNENVERNNEKNEIEYSENDYFCLNYRNSINQLIFNLKNSIIKKMRQILEEDKYIEVFTPKLMRIDKPPKNKSKNKNNLLNQIDDVNCYEQTEMNNNINKIKESNDKTNLENFPELNGSEGGSSCFTIENENIILAQSPQFYKQMIINYDYEKIFEINYSYRNEKFHSTKHLNEFLSLDTEQVIYNNYYEIIIYIYNFLKKIVNYINTNFIQEIALINLIYGKKNSHTSFEPTMITDTPIVLTFCEAHNILKKYYYIKNDIKFCNNCKEISQNGYIYDKQYKMCVKILDENEKNQLKKNIIFEDFNKNKQLHNIYYNNKIANNYKVDIKNCENNYETNISYPNNINQNLHSQIVYSFLNKINKNEIYNDILQFYNNIYDEIISTCKVCQNNFFDKQFTSSSSSSHVKLNTITNMKICQCMPEINNNIHDEKKNQNNNSLFDLNENSFSSEPNEYSYFSGLKKYLEKNINIKISVKEKKEIKKLKKLYIYQKDFTNDELNYLYLFIKYNFNTDIFVIDQYPLHIRPFYSLSNIYDLRFTNSFDFIYKGTEIISGSQRINNLPLLLLRILKGKINNNKNKDTEIDISSYLQINKTNFNLSNYFDDLQKLINKNSTLYKYINSFAYSSKPHGGMALGLDRFFMLLLNLANIKKSTYC
ncbi:aspartate--tRNA ligase, putative [Plasmodium berghei]|uniref:Aspartate--tRNA ligase, putative n=3 Tax=Plasmodium berghei TaxID=5821 RepID=A0A509ASB9_PLABA|nr:aspartate--tRNA ligase, putative [Plasmodium berghei ANKA]CXI62251.1 aspartate--tRNA ligase, putative [Plasmodium berghei]SCN26731.1 aspartate--tRNA ligase, putative [Plasmodium berghei]SCO61040.1 aspartate--tRNA ligase, putative [Plasmodium berghei]VUC56561.1 aspartate--tRNA ligase, putative [Plasmodium berghei ANKA]|eukprot:XP_034422347.1 aspartate--tRNA ligase, putative [Plasmodium berghei ANKA]